MQKNPCNKVHPPKKDYRKSKVLSANQLSSVLNYLKERQQNPKRINVGDYFLATTTGMREGKFCGLK